MTLGGRGGELKVHPPSIKSVGPLEFFQIWRKIVEILVNGKNLMNEYIIVNVYLLLRIVKTQSQVSIKLQAAYDEEITEIIFNSLI